MVSAVEGVQPQTPLLFRALQRLHVPTLIFVNKIDRAGADPDRVLETMARRLTPALVPMGEVRSPGHRDAAFVPFAGDDLVHRTKLAEILAEQDDEIMRAFVGDDESAHYDRLREQLGVQTRRALVHPVFFGSAWHGIGIEELLAGVDGLLSGAPGDPDAEVSGRVFKIERSASGERVAYVRLFAGTLARDSESEWAAERKRRRLRSRSSLRPAHHDATSPCPGKMARDSRARWSSSR